MAKRAESPDGKSLTKKIVSLIEKAAKQYKVPPYNVTSAHFWTVANGKVAEWDVRKLGGFTAIRDLEFPAPEEEKQANSVLPRMAPRVVKYKRPPLENFTVHDSTKMREVFKTASLGENDILRVLVQPDTHVPEHDEIAVQAFLNFAEWYKPHGYINLGDFMEMGSVSHWDAKDSKPRRFAPELKAAKDMLKKIDTAMGPQCVYKRFLIGNHEDWLDQYLVNRAVELYDGLEDAAGVSLRIQDLLGLRDLGYRTVPLNEVLRLGDLHFIHGYYTNKYHAFKHLEVFGCNLMYGHLHDVQTYTGVSVKGVHESMSIGCLRLLNAPFMKGRPNNWSHAFGIVEYRIDGTYTRYVPIIVDGKFSYNGKVFDGRL
jgi:hypothetical protein